MVHARDFCSRKGAKDANDSYGMQDLAVVNVLFSALTRTSISSTFVASNLKFQDHAKERSELSGGVRPLPTLQ